MNRIKQFLKNERGIETVEVVIILVIIVALGFAFRFVVVEWYNQLILEAEGQILEERKNAPYGK